MAIPVHLFLTDECGVTIRGCSDVQDREGSMELRGLHHSLNLPTDPMTGKVTGTRQHSPFDLLKNSIVRLPIFSGLQQPVRH